MSVKKSVSEGKENEVQEQKTIEEWAKLKHTDVAVLGGAKVMQHWNSGKAVSEQEYDTAVKMFRESPARRKRK